MKRMMLDSVVIYSLDLRKSKQSITQRLLRWLTATGKNYPTSPLLMSEEQVIAEDVCEHCGGTGEVTEDIWDEDSHQYHPTGTKKCICQIEKEIDDEIDY